MKLLIASDHAGFSLKSFFLKKLNNIEWQDFGPSNEESVDYPDFARELCNHMSEGSLGILICGSGQGMAMTANKFENVRAALCWSEELAKLAKQHNNANVLCLPARFITEDVAEKILQVFLSTEFEGGRHQKRVDKIKGE